jgi:hypothetical protein
MLYFELIKREVNEFEGIIYKIGVIIKKFQIH